MLRRVPWIALLLTGCEALSGAPPGPGPAPESAPVVGESAIVAPGALRAAIAAGVRRRSENEASYEVDAFVAALAVEELAGGAGGLKVEPAIERGAQVGYRLVEVVPGSAYAHLGLRAGDVIEAIGDVRLDSPGRAAGLMASVGRGARLEVVRDGVGFSLEVRIAGGLSWAELLRSRTGLEGQVVADRTSGAGSIGQVLEDMSAPAAGAPRDGEPGGTRVLPATPSGSSGGAGASGGGKPGQPGRPASGGGSAGPSGATGVQCASTASCTLDRKLFDAAVADPGQLARQASISPVRGGYKLTRVSPGSAVAALGFRAGDVIVSVNGARLDDEVAALGLYMGLGSTRSYNVAYERGGARATKSIALR